MKLMRVGGWWERVGGGSLVAAMLLPHGWQIIQRLFLDIWIPGAGENVVHLAFRNGRIRHVACLAFAACVAAFALGGVASAQSITWAQAGTGTYDWNSSSNWTSATSGTFPNAAGAFANLYVDRTGGQTINLNEQITVGRLLIGDSSTTSLLSTTIAANGGSLVIDSGAVGVSGTIQMNIPTNTAPDPYVTISSGITLASNLVLQDAGVNMTNVLNISGIISETGGSPRNVSLVAAALQKPNFYLTGANTYTGTTSLGSLVFMDFNSIGNVNGGASALGNPATAAAGLIRVGQINSSMYVRMNYTGTSAASTDRQLEILGSGPTGDGGPFVLQSSGGTLTLTNAAPFIWSGTSTTAKSIRFGANVVITGSIGDWGGATNLVGSAGTGSVTLLGLNTFTGGITNYGNSGHTWVFNSIADEGQPSALGAATGANAVIPLAEFQD